MSENFERKRAMERMEAALAPVWVWILVSVLAVSWLILGVLLWERRQRSRELEELISYFMSLQDQIQLPAPARCKEGQAGILQSEVYKLMVQMKEQSDGAVQDKEYLASMLSDISHQIKTPLAAVTIMTDLLKTPDLSEEKRLEFTERIDTQVNRINWLIRNLLTLSQLDSNMLKLKKQRMNAGMLAEKACQPLELAAELKGIELRIEMEEDLELVCDPHWTAEALSNIVKNCVEHTSGGGRVWLKVSQNNFSTNFYVRDNGEGIPREQLSHIFERFYKGATSSPESVGIGLAMAKKIILLQNGTIDVSSQVGQGTEFFIKFYR